MSGKTRTVAIILGALAVLLLWQQVFAMTGVLWWNAPVAAERLPALETVPLARPNISLVDLPAYLAAHPQWRPQ